MEILGWRYRMSPFSRLAISVSVFTCIVYGQIDRANLNGTVTDASGAVIPNALVELVSPSTGFKRQLETGPAGVYSMIGLPIGTYNLTISHDGFRAVVLTGMQL